MILRREMYDAFSAVARSDFRRSLIAFLAEQFESARAMPPAELASAVDLCIGKAESYGLTRGEDVATFAVTAYLLGLDFDRDFPAATNVLLSPVLTSADKAQWLCEWTAELFRTVEAEH